jgi:starch-binding outer membrane protein, SusD/RagB family
MKMKKNIYVILLGITMGLMSCSRVYDDITNYTNLTPDAVWTDESYSTQYINQLYGNMMNYVTQSDAPATEEWGLWQYTVWTTFYSDQMSVSGSGTKSAASFGTSYQDIRNLNTFFENVDKGNYASKKWLKGQAFFMQAFQYFRLVKSFGGVPLVKEVITPSGNLSALGRPRNTTLECFNYIVQMLDSAIVNLPEPTAPGAVVSGYDKFRVNKPIAMILKGEVLMWKASPIFCTTPNATYWNDAYTAVSAAKTYLDGKGYGLYTTKIGKTPPYTGMFYDKVGCVKEWIWQKEYSYPVSNSAGLYSMKQYAPTWNLVQRYMMADGKDTLTSAYTYDRKLYWKNRDPRLKQTIAYNGSSYVFPAVPGALPNPNRHEWIFDGTIQGDYSGASGFLSRKGIDTTLNVLQLATQVQTNWPIYRYAEVLLDLAECANELDSHRGEVAGLLTPIRSRAGIVNLDGSYGLASVPSNHDSWVKIIMNERLVEFAYEGKRVYDIKRRVLFSDFRNYKFLQGLSSIINVPGVDALKLKAARNGATIVIGKLSSLSLSNDDVYRALDDTMAKSANPDQLYQQIFTSVVLTADLAKTYLNPFDSNALEAIPNSVLLADPMVKQSVNYGGPFNPKLN